MDSNYCTLVLKSKLKGLCIWIDLLMYLCLKLFQMKL